MSYFPFFLDLPRLQGLIIGAGYVAEEKISRLLPSGANLTVIAREISQQVRDYEGITILEKEYEKGDLQGFDYIIAATNDSDLNQRIYDDARQMHLLVNVVDIPELCDFIFPSVLKKGKLVIGISTSGAAPQVAIRLRKELENQIPDDIEEKLDYLYQERIRVKKEIADPSERRKYLKGLADRLLDYEDR
jgi:siroheme synthase-like protein